jgi:hypothetical protein
MTTRQSYPGSTSNNAVLCREAKHDGRARAALTFLARDWLEACHSQTTICTTHFQYYNNVGAAFQYFPLATAI